jgi:hypothetical protein
LPRTPPHAPPVQPASGAVPAIGRCATGRCATALTNAILSASALTACTAAASAIAASALAASALAASALAASALAASALAAADLALTVAASVRWRPSASVGLAHCAAACRRARAAMRSCRHRRQRCSAPSTRRKHS